MLGRVIMPHKDLRDSFIRVPFGPRHHLAHVLRSGQLVLLTAAAVL